MRTLPLSLVLLTLLAGCSSASSVVDAPGDAPSTLYEGDGYTLQLPKGWFAHELRFGALVTMEETLPSRPGPEGYTEKPQMAVERIALGEDGGPADARAYLNLTATSPGRDWVHVFEQRDVAGFPAIWTVSDATPMPGQMLRVVLTTDEKTLYAFTAPRYETGSDSAALFERIIASFQIAVPAADAPAEASSASAAPIETIVPET